MPVFLDAGGVDTPLNPELLPHLAVLSPNETELARLTGMPTDTEEDVKRAAQALQVRCCTLAACAGSPAAGGGWSGVGAPPEAIQVTQRVRLVAWTTAACPGAGGGGSVDGRRRKMEAGRRRGVCSEGPTPDRLQSTCSFPSHMLLFWCVHV